MATVPLSSLPLGAAAALYVVHNQRVFSPDAIPNFEIDPNTTFESPTTPLSRFNARYRFMDGVDGVEVSQVGKTGILVSQWWVAMTDVTKASDIDSIQLEQLK